MDAGLPDPTQYQNGILRKSKKIREVTCQNRLGGYHSRPIGLLQSLSVGR